MNLITENLFLFGDLHSSNIPNDLSDVRIKNKDIKMTASEAKTFCTFLPLIIGSQIPLHDPVWQYLLCLLKILHIVLQRDLPHFTLQIK